MSEAELIEISERFRRLEDACDQADTYLTLMQYRLSGQKERMAAIRDRIETALEACRDDMVKLQELARARQKPVLVKIA